MQCPLVRAGWIASQRGDKGPGLAEMAECLREECAWFLPEATTEQGSDNEGRCSIPFLASTMAQTTASLARRPVTR